MPKKRKPVKLGGRRTPIRPKKIVDLSAKLEAEADALQAEVLRRPRKRAGSLTSTQKRASRKVVRTIKRHPKAKAKLRTIPIDVEIKPAQSVRGTFESGTFITQDSEIIHFFEYDIVSKLLAVQLTAAGNWNWYTYHGVSAQTAANFEAAPSKGQYYNAVIKKHSFSRGNTIRGFKTISEI